jgi:hypothetical protein
MPRYSRPSERVQQLIAMLRAGNYLDVACRAAGVAVEDLADWVERSDELARQVAQAVAEGEARAVTQIAQAARENWQAAAWLLERQFPERWARPLARTTDEAVPALGSDGVDELASKRATRRAHLSP